MATRRPRSRPSTVLLVILLCAFAVGASASILVGARSAGPAPPVGPTSELILPTWLISVIIIGLALVIILPVIVARLSTKNPSGTMTPFAVAGLSLLLAGVIMVAILHAVGGGPTGYTSPPPQPAGNQTAPAATNNTTVNSTLVGGPGGVLDELSFHLPAWTWFLLLVVVLAGVVILALPPLANYLQDRRDDRLYRERSDQATAQVRGALRKARADLDSAADPRATILALYATLLARLQPVVTDLDAATPEEIRTQHLIRLGIRAPAARTLTRVFEEARYSSHPLGPLQVASAREAIGEAEQDLSRALGGA